MTRGTLTLALLGCLATGAIALPVSAQDGQCQKLQTTYREEMNSAGSLKSKAAQRAVEQGSKTLSKLGIQLSSSGNTEQAIQKGALAATSPQMQAAIMIQLLSANTHLQEMMWRGCKPGSGSSG